MRKPDLLDTEPFTLRSISKPTAEKVVDEIIDRFNERRRGKTGRMRLIQGQRKNGAPIPGGRPRLATQPTREAEPP